MIATPTTMELRPMTLFLSPVRRRVLEAFQRESPYHPWPTVREVAKRVGISSTSVANYHIHELVDMGLLAHYSPNGTKKGYIYSSRCVGLTPAGEAWIERHSPKGSQK